MKIINSDYEHTLKLIFNNKLLLTLFNKQYTTDFTKLLVKTMYEYESFVQAGDMVTNFSVRVLLSHKKIYITNFLRSNKYYLSVKFT